MASCEQELGKDKPVGFVRPGSLSDGGEEEFLVPKVIAGAENCIDLGCCVLL